MSKKRKNNPGGAIWLILGLAAGGGFIWAVSQGAFDHILGEPKPKKKKKEKKLPPPEEKDEEVEFMFFDVEEPWPEVPEDMLFNNGLTINEACTTVVEGDVDLLLERMADLFEAMSQEGDLADAPPFDMLVASAIYFLEHGIGTEGCLDEEDLQEDPDTEENLFKAALLIYTILVALEVAGSMGFISDQDALQISQLMLQSMEDVGIDDTYFIDHGFPFPESRLDEATFVDPDAPDEMRFEEG